MIESKKLKLKIASILLIIGIDMCIGSIPLFLLGNSNILKKNQMSDFNKIKLSNQAYINNSEQKLFWFIHITDTHVESTIDIFNQLLNETFHEIKPLFIYNTGDLVDANSGLGQDVEEWKLYQTALEDNSMNSSNYIDLIGNHDAANDPKFSYYLNYSMIGRNFKSLQFSFNKSFSFGRYAFIGVNTAKDSYNIYEFALLGSLNTTELDWYENELEKYKNFDRIFVFGHHSHNNPPPYSIISNLSTSGKNFFDLNEEYNVDYYLSGHAHEHYFQKDKNLLMITTSNFDLHGGTYRIVTLDYNHLSTSIEQIDTWPQAVITYPSNEHTIIEDLTQLRVLAWDPRGINSVEWSLHSVKKEFQITSWNPLDNLDLDDPLWEGNFDFQFNGKYILKVKIEGGSGQIIKEVRIFSKSGWKFEFAVSLIFMIIAFLSIAIIIFNYSRIHIEKLKKRNK
jgi:predicted MPP superfamily phosphohydrolase